MSYDVLIGNALDELKRLPDESVDCIITSPPYWGLRDYGAEAQLGLEPTLAEYIDNLLAITAELKRVLKPAGTLWWNHGDSYYNGSKWSYTQGGHRGLKRKEHTPNGPRHGVKNQMPEKTLTLQPYRLAIRMVDEQGWTLRNDIVWHKPNAMPQSVKDRFTQDFEPVLLFAKSRRYHFVPQYEPWVYRARDLQRAREDHPGYAGKHSDGHAAQGIKGQPVGDPDKGRNKRAVWTIPTAPNSLEHFAMFPEKLIEPMVLAGCPEGGLVLDPFSGAATTGVVAIKHGRRYIGIELNPDYAEKSLARLKAAEPPPTLFGGANAEPHATQTTQSTAPGVDAAPNAALE